MTFGNRRWPKERGSRLGWHHTLPKPQDPIFGQLYLCHGCGWSTFQVGQPQEVKRVPTSWYRESLSLRFEGFQAACSILVVNTQYSLWEKKQTNNKVIYAFQKLNPHVLWRYQQVPSWNLLMLPRWVSSRACREGGRDFFSFCCCCSNDGRSTWDCRLVDCDHCHKYANVRIRWSGDEEDGDHPSFLLNLLQRNTSKSKCSASFANRTTFEFPLRMKKAKLLDFLNRLSSFKMTTFVAR